MHMAGRLAGIPLVVDRTPYVVLPAVAVRQSWFLWCETSHYNKAGSAPRGTRARRNPDSEQKGDIQAGNVRVNNGDVTSMCMSNRPERWLSLLQLVQNERGGPHVRCVCTLSVYSLTCAQQRVNDTRLAMVRRVRAWMWREHKHIHHSIKNDARGTVD